MTAWEFMRAVALRLNRVYGPGRDANYTWVSGHYMAQEALALLEAMDGFRTKAVSYCGQCDVADVAAEDGSCTLCGGDTETAELLIGSISEAGTHQPRPSRVRGFPHHCAGSLKQR